MRNRSALVLVLILVSGGQALSQSPPVRVPVVMDTDLGSDLSDAFALALLLGSPEVDLRGVTAVGGDTRQRALMLCRFLTMTGRRSIAVAAGAAPQPPAAITRMYPYYYHPDVLFDRTTRPIKQSAGEFLHARLKAQPGRVTVLATGPLSNVAQLLRDRADARKLVQRVVALEDNLARDVAAARMVLTAGVPLDLIPRQRRPRLTEAGRKQVFAPGTSLTRQVEALYQMDDVTEVSLADALAAAVCFTDKLGTWTTRALEIDDRGTWRAGKGKPNVRILTDGNDASFVDWYIHRLGSLLPPERVPVRPVPQGNMPNRIHVAEDFETDIERRWWLSGKVETRNVPPGSRRACRAVLTHDFDDLLMVSRTMYKAVIFNPVPGPPMGKNTRLRFRCWLQGTDRLRVQIYSLTNGYHRHLVLKGLPEKSWQSVTVDMTQARRPDGTGGPLAEGERIDDIQFYTDASAELILDDIVLYDAAMVGEKRPFPARVHFTGWFDSGVQGKEWPGTFEIVPEQGSFWKAARSVADGERNLPWIRLHLRGERRLGERTHLTFRYRLTGASGMAVELVNSRTKERYPVEPTGLKRDTWGEASIDFTRAGRRPAQGAGIDEIHFTLPRGATLLLDDVLLFEPQ